MLSVAAVAYYVPQAAILRPSGPVMLSSTLLQGTGFQIRTQGLLDIVRAHEAIR